VMSTSICASETANVKRQCRQLLVYDVTHVLNT
jgi:hypothetical protein